jgi:hypothetical protein
MKTEPRRDMKRLLPTSVLALVLIAGASMPAHASGETAAFLTQLAGGLVAQLIEGVFVALIAVRRLGRDGVLVILFFTLGMVVSWWFVLSVDGVIPLTESLLGKLGASSIIVAGILQGLFWLMILIVGPVAAGLATLLVRAIHRQRTA